MKKINNIISFSTMILLLIMFTSCANKNIDVNKDDNIKITVTNFPIYDYVRNVMGEKFVKENVRLLLDNGMDLHNYQITAKDILDIQKSDILFCIGGESDDRWLSRINSNNVKIVKFMDVIKEDVLYEELKEGMNEEPEEEHTEEAEHLEHDEHVWLSIKNTEKFVKAIKENISSIDKENEQIYEANAQKYLEKLDELDKEYQYAFKDRSRKIFIFADRFPFLYLFRNYHIDYYAAFKGCSAETESSFYTISFLSQKIDEMDKKYIFKLEGSKDDLAKTIIRNSNKKNVEILEVSSIENVFDLDNNNYIDIMKKNLQIFKKAIGD